MKKNKKTDRDTHKGQKAQPADQNKRESNRQPGREADNATVKETKKPDGQDPAAGISEYQEKIDSLQASLDEANDKFLRLFSEFDNYRKRVTKERIELSKTAAEGIITALLPVLDDLERASSIARMKQDKEAEEEGVILIYNKFKSILRQKGVEDIPCEGTDFNTDYHEAINHVPAGEDEQKGKVVEEVQKGYLLNGKVIRHARVVVAN